MIKGEYSEGAVMNYNDIQTQVRSVEGFHRVRLESQHINQMILTQGQREALTIQAPREILDRLTTPVKDGKLTICLRGSWTDRLRDALTTSLTRPRIKYSLEVKELTSLEAYAMLDLSIGRLRCNYLEMAFGGMGQIDIQELDAQGLRVNLTGAGRMDIAGQVLEQHITIRGMGEYHAPELESQETWVGINGPGKATVWASEQLEVDIRGPGAVYYYGSPTIRKRLVPIGVLTRLYRERAVS